MNVVILEKFGKSGLTMYEPPVSIDELDWKGVTDTFKEAFQKAWRIAYDWECYEGNAGINQLSILHDMNKRLYEGTLDTSLSFDEAYDEQANISFDR